ncbi:MAG: ParB/RepB/Spo0J family partition protein [Fimbriimonadales bacterium]|nr:ParB/RepB/Spo0J family partition protein [Fimbriimonadales bacterium]
MREALGKGLIQLLSEQEQASLREIPVDAIQPNPRQPRKRMDEDALRSLAESLKKVGVVQPVIVRIVGQNQYELIAGERRWRAAKMAGLQRIPAVIRTADTIESLQIALVENLQREDISPLEAAEAYQVLIDEFGLTQEEVAQRVGKSRPTITNALRLLRLPPAIRESLASGNITEGHARALLQCDTETEMLLIHEQILKKGLSVRQVERLARQKGAEAPSRTPSEPSPITPLERALSERLGAPVRIRSQKGRGQIVIDYFGEEDLARVLEAMGVTLEE